MSSGVTSITGCFRTVRGGEVVVSYGEMMKTILLKTYGILVCFGKIYLLRRSRSRDRVFVLRGAKANQG